jgi:5'-nucleotidase
VPAIAVSVAAFREQDFTGATTFLRDLVAKHPERLTRPGTLLNINVPNLPPAAIRGVAVTRLGSRYYGDVILRKEDPRGREYFWIGGEEPTWREGDDSDFHAVHRRQQISVTPLALDLTDHGGRAALAPWTEQWP